MRINEQQTVSDLLYSLGQDNQSINKLQNQISSGQIVTTPSDDPTLNQRLMLLQGQLDQNNVYTQNASYASNFLTQQSSALSGAANVLTSIKTLLLSSANDTNPQDQQNYATQLGEYVSQLLDLANSQYDGKYIFGGTQTTTRPFFMKPDQSAVTVNPAGIGGALAIDVNNQQSQQYNITGSEAFSNGQIFNDLISIKNELNGGGQASQADISTVDNYLNSMINTNAEAGAMTNRLSLVQSQLTSENQTLQATMSNLGDTDVAAAVIQLQQQQTALNAALKTGSGIIQMSLAEYL